MPQSLEQAFAPSKGDCISQNGPGWHDSHVRSGRGAAEAGLKSGAARAALCALAGRHVARKSGLT